MPRPQLSHVLARSFLLAGLLCGWARAAPADPLRPYRDFAARRDGDAVRGREVFLRQETACSFCHSVDGSNSKAGPDLVVIGDALGRSELIDGVLTPNAVIAVGYEATLVETRSGESHYGVIKSSNNEAVELMTADGRRTRIARSDLKSTTTAERSLMPDGLHSSLSTQEFADLIEYLSSLKEPASARAGQAGMPADIPVLAKPIIARPLFGEELRFPASVVRKPGDVRLGLVWCGEIPGSTALLVAHQSGQLWRLDRSGDAWTKSAFADFAAELYSRTGPNGLLGVAFHPQFPSNRKYYLKHQVHEEGQILTTVVEKIAAADFRHDSGTPSRRLIALPCITQNHTGGCIEFGPDGFLYIGMGDTGPQRDPNGHGQDRQLLLGKVLRIDVDRRDGALAYGIPADNPFVARPDTRPEIWASGFREPWRFSFDRPTGDLWVGDVGQDRVEEVAIVRRGENHGWNVYEGFEPFSNSRRSAKESYVAPVFAYRRRFGNSITGGFVYRGDARSSFSGVYVFGDYTSKKIFGLTQRDRRLLTVREIGQSPESIASFGTDSRGNIYLVGYEGMIFQLDFSGAVFEHTPPPSPSGSATPKAGS
jgi:putative heme-binding domain-containing protein